MGVPEASRAASAAKLFTPRGVAVDPTTGDVFVSTWPLHGSSGGIYVVHPTDRSFALVSGGEPFALPSAQGPPSAPVIGVPARRTTLPAAGGLAVIDGDLIVPGSQIYRIRANDTVVELLAGRAVRDPPECDGDGGPATAAAFGGACRATPPAGTVHATPALPAAGYLRHNSPPPRYPSATNP